MATVLVIEHVPHERLGTLEAALAATGVTVQPVRADEPTVRWPALDGVAGLIVMGGPMSVSQQAAYPFLRRELALLREALQQRRPILGICLGAQLLAHALGARVRPAEQAEIGWYPLRREPAAAGDALLEAFGETETVFQWHSDTYELPEGAVRLASSPGCTGSLESARDSISSGSRGMEQAFRDGEDAYALQFHVEMTEAMIRAWMRKPDNQAALMKARGVDGAAVIQQETRQYLGRLGELSRRVGTAFGRLVRQQAATPRRTG